MENESKRKAIILTFIGALTLLFVVVGGTFAYFQIVNTSEGSTSTDFNAQTDNLNKYGIPLLTKKSDLYISLSASDMAYSKGGTPYYATVKTEQQEKNYEEEKQNHVISTASIKRPDSDDAVENAYLKCTSELTITITGEMKDVLQTGDGTLYLGTKSSEGNSGSVTPASFDLADLVSKEATKENKATVNYTITGFTSVDVTADIEIVNKEGTPQNALAGTDIQITITNSNLSCSVSEKPTAPGTILEGKSNLTTELINGMYRYQGNSIIDLPSEEMEMPNVTDTVDNNYICLGTNCSEENQYADMYRIIGITPDNVIKVVKMKAIDGYYQWASDYETDTPWNESKIYNKLNIDGDSFLSTLDANLQNKILNYQWKYGAVPTDVEGDDELYNQIEEAEDGSEKDRLIKEYEQLYLDAIASEETKATSQIEAKIGLMSASDYCYSFESGSDINCVSSLPLVNGWSEDYNLGMSWLSPMNNDSEISWEWTMTYFGLNPAHGGYYAWAVGANGSVDINTLYNEIALRPSFYLASDIELTGEGTKTNPYRIQGLEGAS